MDAPWLSIAAFFRALADAHGAVGAAMMRKAVALAGAPAVAVGDAAWNTGFVGACLRLSGYESSGTLEAESYGSFGRALAKPRGGCVVTFARPRGVRRVGFCQSVAGDKMTVLSAQGSGAIDVSQIAVAQALALRWPEATAPLPVDTDLPTVLTVDPDNAPLHLFAGTIIIDLPTPTPGRSRVGLGLGPTVQSVVMGQGTPTLGAMTKGLRTFASGKRDRTGMVFATDELGAGVTVPATIQPLVLGTDVAALQHSLDTYDFDIGAVDGVFGPRTRNALMSFQKRTGIAASGVADAPTWEALSIGKVRVPETIKVEVSQAGKPRTIKYPVTPSDVGPSNVDLFFATTRRAESADDTSFTDARSDELNFGKLAVTIPPTHRVGVIERPIVNLKVITIQWRPENQNKDFVITTRSRLGKADFIAEVKAWSQDQALVFVHGFNTRFDDAAYRMAQIVSDLQFKGVPVLFSWPSRGGVLAYFYDRDSALFSRDGLVELLNLLRHDAGISTVHVVAHSMGNQIVVDTLSTKGVLTWHLAQVILAAPDVDRDVFSLLARRIKAVAKRVTLYASQHDRALKLSRKFAESPRAGDVPDGEPLIVPNLDTIDVSAIGAEIFGLGHTTFATNRSVIDDVGRLLKGAGAPDERSSLIRGVPATATPPKYWRYVP